MKALYKADAITKYKKPVNKQVTDMTLGQSASEMMYVTNKNKGLIICFKNGSNDASSKPKLHVRDKNGIVKIYPKLTVYCSDDNLVYDNLNDYNGYDFFKYLDMLKELNDELRIDMNKTAGHIFSGTMAEVINSLT